MTFNFHNIRTGQSQLVSARCDAHAWGCMLCQYGELFITEWQLVGASSFGRRLWGEV